MKGMGMALSATEKTELELEIQQQCHHTLPYIHIHFSLQYFDYNHFKLRLNPDFRVLSNSDDNSLMDCFSFCSRLT